MLGRRREEERKGGRDGNNVVGREGRVNASS